MHLYEIVTISGGVLLVLMAIVYCYKKRQKRRQNHNTHKIENTQRQNIQQNQEVVSVEVNQEVQKQNQLEEIKNRFDHSEESNQNYLNNEIQLVESIASVSSSNQQTITFGVERIENLIPNEGFSRYLNKTKGIKPKPKQ